MPRIDSVEGFNVGDRVTITSTNSRRPYESKGSFNANEPATVAWFYASDANGEEFVYVTLDRPIGYQPATDAMGYPTKGDPIFGPFAFAASDLQLGVNRGRN